MTGPRTEDLRRAPRALRRTGFLLAAAANLAGMWIVNHLLDWGWPAFVTAELEDVLPYINASFGASAVVNVLWGWQDPEWFRHLGQAGLNAVTLVAAARTWQVFPFDFSGYAAAWELLTRMLLVVAVVGSALSIVVELVNLARGCEPAAPLRHRSSA
jgi:hypothetical protein